MTDEMKRALLGDILEKVGMDGIGQVVLEQNNAITVGREKPVQMPPYLTQERAVAIYEFLISSGYISTSTTSDEFLYLMGVTSEPPLKMKPINWLKTVQQLRTMITLAWKVPLERGSLKLAELEKRVPFCFLNKGAKMKVLAKPSVENSYEMDMIANFFRPK